ncbi:molybdopterin guanine dinucleotide-containing S/N-oxide reductase [Cupriavidus consociatus]|uniref:molybdopterin guanine dinucleotide-containing S/N-oxide reductase n=1 Tax=Cupriavidus consociatus TaxID=2821357 RepID=UPI001AE6D61B|nr:MULTISPECIES: molybdopterin guanine dinucleotide-containing S/N-oxide reductase [unclassified Cupriavidus]MBP0623372.1 molybdopterin guanine dinucleotide-containing S/N-oxide reductase [Cupriavidus sp. LEh25]MDK2660070.1 molybdopterin guanine dinucleotide-containing S/N-oxide reductase [Cupriavidus sp. LEh21]
MQQLRTHSAHWGAFHAGMQDGRLVVTPHPGDPDPNPLIDNFPDALRHPARIAAPAIRRSWLERGPGADILRGGDEYVQVSWDKALDLLAGELRRLGEAYGPSTIYGGSYGWSSAGRFHHVQSQIHRFLNVAMGGYVRSVNTYSGGCAEVLIPHVLGSYEKAVRRNVTWDQIAQRTDVVLAFGGMALKNSRVAGGGVSRHVERGAMREAAGRGCRFVCISPLSSDLPEEAAADWMPVIPGTDIALMLGIAHTLVSDGSHDRAFLAQYCSGWEEFETYLSGHNDGVKKNAEWAASICGVSAEEIQSLARSLPGRRVLITVSHSLQRAERGEQPVWMGAVLAAMLGQIGLPGGGYSYALGTLAHYGRRNNAVPSPSLSQGTNGVKEFIPVARIADMLLNPGQSFDYNGQRLVYPHVRMAYWAGGNPFHHHQDLPRLTRAISTLDTFVVHDHAWTATARHADIVLPATMTLEREDIGSAPTDPLMLAMHRIAEPYGEARDDYEIFCGLAQRLGVLDEFSEGRSSREWLQHLYAKTREALAEIGHEAPDFDTFWRQGELVLPQADDDGGMMRAFRNDPQANPLATPSGKIQVSSPVIESFGYDDCPGHPAWVEPTERPTKDFPLHLISNQPASRLHSQLDFGGHSQSTKLKGREVCSMHPATAADRGIREGDLVRLFNSRGACIAAARLTEQMHPGVVQLPTGAWYDPMEEASGKTLCVHGNPNVMTRDIGTSRLTQGCSGQLTIVQAERFDGAVRAVSVFEPPRSAVIE